MMNLSSGACAAYDQLAAIFDADPTPTVVLNEANVMFYHNLPAQDVLQKKFIEQPQSEVIDIALFLQLSVSAQKNMFAEQILPTLDIGRLLSRCYVKPLSFSIEGHLMKRFSMAPRQINNAVLEADVKTLLLTGWHDIRNLLGITRNQIELLQINETSLSDNAVDRLQKINEAAKTACLIAEKMTSFQVQHVPVQDCNVLLNTAAVILTGIVPPQMQLKIENWPEPLLVKVTQDGLNNALVNLVFNAVEAFEDSGSIEIKCAEQWHPEIGRAVCVTVSDTGCGIDDSRKQAVLEAFNSEKSDTQLHGMGLFSVQQFVKDAGGVMKITDNSPSGTQVHLFFPWQTND